MCKILQDQDTPLPYVVNGYSVTLNNETTP